MRSRTRTPALLRPPRTATLAAALLGLLLPLFVLGAPAHAAPAGFRVENGRLLERSGNDFVMRGVNHAHTWYPNRIGSLAHIKAKGANTVRVVLASGDRWTRNDTTDVANVVAQCKRNRLICVLEVHDTTGYGEQSGAITLSRAADYWISVQSALTGQEDHVIVNIGNEPYGNNNYAGWTFPDSQRVSSLWGGTAAQSGAAVTVRRLLHRQHSRGGLGHPRLHGDTRHHEPRSDHFHAQRGGLHIYLIPRPLDPVGSPWILSPAPAPPRPSAAPDRRA